MMMTRCKQIFPRLSLAIRLCHPSLLQVFLTTPCVRTRAVVDKFLSVVEHLHVRVKESIGECLLCVRLYFVPSISLSISLYIYTSHWLNG